MDDKKLGEKGDSDAPPPSVLEGEKGHQNDTDLGDISVDFDTIFDSDSEHATQDDDQIPPTPSLKKLLFSPDYPSRLMSVLSVFFALLASFCLIILISTYLQYRKAHSSQKKVAEKPLVADQIYSESLGEFHLFLKPEQAKNDGELRVTMVVECASKVGCDKIKEHLPESRDIILPILSAAGREEMLNLETKNRIRRKITERLESS